LRGPREYGLILGRESSPPEFAELVTARLRANPQALVNDYRRRFGDEFNPDNGAELFAEYNCSPQSRAKYRLAVAGACGWTIDEAFRQRIAMSDRRPVVFSAGGTASGKSIMTVDEVRAGAIVLDSTFSNYALSRQRVQEALDSGRKVVLQYIYREILEAYGAAIARSQAEGAGRVVSALTHTLTHKNAPKTVAQLVEDFSGDGRVWFQLYESSCVAGFERGSSELVRRAEYAREITEGGNVIMNCAAVDHQPAPALYPKMTVKEFEALGFPQQAAYLSEVALASGNRYRNRAELLVRENPHRNFRGSNESELIGRSQ
jgi:Zeta toxin